MRLIAFVVLLGACMPRFDRAAHTGPDGQASGARLLQLSLGVGEARGIVTARGGDAVDWVAFDAPLDPSRCTVRIFAELHWKAPRPDLRLALSIWDADGHRLGRAKDGWRHGTSIILEDLHPGRYLAKVYAPRRDDAGEYDLVVNTASVGCPGVGTLFHVPRPAGAVAPSSPPASGHRVVDVRAFDVDERTLAGTVTLAAGTTQGIGPGWMGQLLDDTGAPVEHGELVVMEGEDDHSRAKLFDGLRLTLDVEAGAAAWTAELWPPPLPAMVKVAHAPVPAAITDLYQVPYGSVVAVDRGLADGLRRGWRVVLDDPPPGGARIPIVWLDVHRALGFAEGMSPHLPAAVGATVAPP